MSRPQYMRVAASCLVVVLAVPLLACDGFGGSTIVVSPNDKFQVMRGWEAHVGGMPECNQTAWNIARDRVLELSANDLGINRVRVPLRSGFENPVDHFTPYMRGESTFDDWKRTWTRPENDDDDPFHANPAGFQWAYLDHTIETVVLPLREKLKARGENLWVNLQYVGGRNLVHATHPEEYAELVVATFEHLRQRFGLTPNSLDIINEPNMRGTWTPQQVARALLAVQPRLARAGFNPEFVGPSTTTVEASLEFLNAMLTIPGVQKVLSDVSYHGYGGGEPAVRRLADRATGLGYRTAMLEKMGADEHDLYRDLTAGQVSAWGQFGMVHCTKPDSGDGGGVYIRMEQVDPEHPKSMLATKSRRLRHYFRYVRLGAFRVGATGGDTHVQATAFVNPDGKQVVVANADRDSELRIRGLGAGTYGVRYTTDSEDNASARDTTIAVGATLLVRLPGRGVITVFGK